MDSAPVSGDKAPIYSLISLILFYFRQTQSNNLSTLTHNSISIYKRTLQSIYTLTTKWLL